VKSAEEIMNMLEAFDLTGSLRDAGELAGCSHHTVAGYVAAPDAGSLSVCTTSTSSSGRPPALRVRELFQAIAEQVAAGTRGPSVGPHSGREFARLGPRHTRAS